MPLSKEYTEHTVFKKINAMIGFYEDLSFLIFRFITTGTSSAINIDSYVYSSIQGTLESIRLILANGRINDSYTLLRKYYDSCIINIYSNLYLEDNCNLNNFIVTKIDNWLKGKEQLPKYREMSQYVRNSTKLSTINLLLHKDNRYKEIRGRCNDNTHYNYYYNILLNDNKIYLENRIKVLSTFSYDIEQIFILHLAYLFYLNQHYMASTDYADSMDLGQEPQKGSQYFVAPFIQKIFNDFIKSKRIDIAEAIKSQTDMFLE
ncbi:MAG: hypothetical protein KAU01_04305 [Candidatus Cloacimonetes bacterium]|nr:hypothetical protein [Candidatus Cloacimonadota bacterium]